MCDGKTVVGTGGMYSKLLAARRAAQLAVPTLIVSGRTPFALEKAFDDEDMGTWVLPAEHAVSRRKFWMAYHAKPCGQIWIRITSYNVCYTKLLRCKSKWCSKRRCYGD